MSNYSDVNVQTPDTLAKQNDSKTHEIMTAQGGLSVESSRAIASVQAAMVMASKCPRKETTSWSRMKRSCSRLRFAEKALFAYKRGSKLVTGPTVRLAECLAAAWGNLDMGFKVLEEMNTGYLIQVFCHDLESNLRITREFIVSRNRYTGGDPLTAERDILENIASVAQRGVRSVVTQCLPADFVEDAIYQCRKTMENGDGQPLKDRVRNAVVAFEEIGVGIPLLEEFLGHNMESTEPIEIPKLQGAYQSIMSGMAKREDLFNVSGTITPSKKEPKETETDKKNDDDKQKSKSTKEQTNEKTTGLNPYDELVNVAKKKWGSKQWNIELKNLCEAHKVNSAKMSDDDAAMMLDVLISNVEK